MVALYLNSENKILFLSISFTPNTVLLFAQCEHNAVECIRNKLIALYNSMSLWLFMLFLLA